MDDTAVLSAKETISLLLGYPLCIVSSLVLFSSLGFSFIKYKIHLNLLTVLPTPKFYAIGDDESNHSPLIYIYLLHIRLYCA